MRPQNRNLPNRLIIFSQSIFDNVFCATRWTKLLIRSGLTGR